MFINKIGYEHIQRGQNCQDFGIVSHKQKLVCDGCSEGSHTEVGAKTFCHLISCGYNINQAFEKLIDIFGQNTSTIKQYLCFTILILSEQEDRFELSFCGDGYIILEDRQGNITFSELTDGEYPKYYAYNYVPENLLSHYKKGVKFTHITFQKTEYSEIGIASDGLRFLINAENDLKTEFFSALKSKKEAAIKRLINKNQTVFKDDITIAF